MDKKLFRSYMLLITFAVVLVLVITKIDLIAGALGVVLRLLRPFFIGFAIAFVLNIPYEIIRKSLNRHQSSNQKIGQKMKKLIAIIGAYIVSFGIFGGVIAIVIPELVRSIDMLINNSDIYLQNFQNFLVWMGQVDLADLSQLDMNKLISGLETEINDIMDQAVEAITVLFPQIFNVTSNIITGVANIGIGLIVSVYLLASKETLCHQVKRLTYAFLPKKAADTCVDVCNVINQCFTSFVTGQLMEACILGLLCFIGMKIFRFEYAFLISLLVGVSAIIPIVGAFIGTVPAVILLFLVEPMQAVWFIVFIIVLQQIEGHLIYPKVVGEVIGLPPLWVLLGIVVGGGLGGILGMLLGVPMVTVIYKLTSQIMDKRLKQKNLVI